MQKGQIFKVHSDFYYVHSESGSYECKIREVLKKQKQKIFVGDYVEFENGAIERILPRFNYITRPTVANIDRVIIISAVKEPELNFTQLNRYISFAKYHNLEAVLCFNKNDLSEDDKTIEKVFSIYQPLGYDILFTSALEGYGIDEFKELLRGKTSVLCGSSGVGKSNGVHESSHGYDLWKNGRVTENTAITGEVKAYSRQFSFDKSSMPVSDFGQANSLGDINHRWVLGINNSGDYLYIRYVYPNKNPKDILRIIK